MILNTGDIRQVHKLLLNPAYKPSIYPKLVKSTKGHNKLS